MKDRAKLYIVMLFLIIIVVAIPISLIIKQRESKKHEEYLKKCEDAKKEMVDIVEKHFEALNNQDDDAFISLCSDGMKEYYPDVDSMYSFLSKDMYDFSEPIDNNDFTFSLTRVDYNIIDHYFEENGFEEALEHGIFVQVKLGDSKMQYDQTWKVVFVLEDGRIKIDQVWLIAPDKNDNATLKEVK